MPWTGFCIGQRATRKEGWWWHGDDGVPSFLFCILHFAFASPHLSWTIIATIRRPWLSAQEAGTHRILTKTLQSNMMGSLGGGEDEYFNNPMMMQRHGTFCLTLFLDASNFYNLSCPCLGLPTPFPVQPVDAMAHSWMASRTCSILGLTPISRQEQGSDRDVKGIIYNDSNG